MTKLFAATPLIALLAQTAAAQAAAPYRVGPGDVIEVSVDGRPDLSRVPTVQTTGSVFLPRAGDVDVRGLTTADIAARVAPLLAGDDLKSPRVAVRVAAYKSQFVWVTGAVNRPGRKPLRAGTRLVDALLDAGGFVPGASGKVIVVREGGFADGSREQVFQFDGQDPSPEQLQRLGLPLQTGDRITATIQYWVAVSGAVRRPGQYALEGGLTLVGLVDQAEPLRSSSGYVVMRRDGVDTELDLGDIRDGKTPDVPLQAGDGVLVKARRP